jgi:energy-coupling factor transport system ATP-binding protein
VPIEISDLCHVYSPGTVFEHHALKNVNLRVDDGEFLGIIGHTGSGKSTLVQHLNVLLKPTSGVVTMDGEDINAGKKGLKALRAKVGLVFQYPEHQLFDTTVLKDVMFGPLNAGVAKEEAERQAREALLLAGIGEELFEKSPFELSGGQKRRAAIAGVLAMSPKILILDEPAAGLDPRGRDEILNKIKDMRGALNITVIMVSHSMEDIARLAERIVVMSGGEIVMDGLPSDVFEQAELLEKIGLAAPKVTYLMKALRQRGFELPSGIFTAEAAAEAIYLFMDKNNGKRPENINID